MKVEKLCKMKTYTVIFQTIETILSEFQLTAANLNAAKSLAQLHKRQFAKSEKINGRFRVTVKAN